MLTLRIIVFRIPSTPYLKSISYKLYTTTRHRITLHDVYVVLSAFIYADQRYPDKCQKREGPYNIKLKFIFFFYQIKILSPKLKLRLFASVILNNWIVFIMFVMCADCLLSCVFINNMTGFRGVYGRVREYPGSGQ